MKLFLVSLFLLGSLNTFAKYPKEWWKKVPETSRRSWEVLPQDAKKGQVVLSKRTELGIFSNLARAHFVINRVYFWSVEAFWQSLKYPEEDNPNDPRHQFKGYPYKRHEVIELSDFACKRAGDKANSIMRKNNFNLVSYEGKFFDYKDKKSGSEFHYKLIYRAIKEKVMQNPKIRELLRKTKGLELVPDHNIKNSSPKSYFYHKILMDIRSNL